MSTGTASYIDDDVHNNNNNSTTNNSNNVLIVISGTIAYSIQYSNMLYRSAA